MKFRPSLQGFINKITIIPEDGRGAFLPSILTKGMEMGRSLQLYLED
jgi:hypothetical protein